jgi:hypothetical protein
MQGTGTRRLLVVLILLGAPLAWSETVYRTVDEKGVVSFSDSPPADDVEAEKITIDAPQPQSPEAARQRLEDMRETTDRMAADRREREKHRAEMRELQARSQPVQRTAYADDYYDDYYPVYTSGRIHRRNYYGGTPWRPGHRPGIGPRPPRPEHPIARPPLRPGLDHRPGYRPQGNVNLGSNSQLMRPIVSPRR